MAEENSRASPVDIRRGSEGGHATAPGGCIKGALESTLEPLAAPVTRLYRHALESIFRFLTLNDLGRVLVTCRYWSSTVRHMPSIRGRVSRFSGPCSALAASGLAVHVASFRMSSWLSARPDDKGSDLSLLARVLPALTDLTLKIAMPLLAPIVFAPRLRSLHLNMQGSRMTVAFVDAMIVAVSNLAALVILRLQFEVIPSLNFAPLGTTPTLHTLRCEQKTAYGSQLAVESLRSLHRLRTVDIASLDNARLASLLQPPHQLAWNEIHRIPWVDEATANAIASLPSLTALDADTCMSLACFPHLLHLRSLRLQIAQQDADPWPVWSMSAGAVVDALLHCTQLERLDMAAPITTEDMVRLLDGLPHLFHLGLLYCWLQSLAFLGSCQTPKQLRSLSIMGCAPPLAELDWLRSLPSLSTLTLPRSFKLDRPTLSLYRPPSVRLPALTKFDYIALNR